VNAAVFKSTSFGLFVLAFCVAGCSASRQSATELNTGLAWFVSPERVQDWPLATEAPSRMERPPAVVIAWSPVLSQGAATRAVRAAWIVTIKDKLERSGRVARADASAPDTFEGGVTAARLQALAVERGADVVILFGIETATRRYHAFDPRPGMVSDVASVVEVVALAKAVGVSPAGVPLFADTQKGFATADIQKRTVEELEATSQRVAVDLLSDAIIRRVRQISGQSGA
jgi:hypothetical protein